MPFQHWWHVLPFALGLIFCPTATAQEDPIVRAVLEDPFSGCLAVIRGKPLLDACDRAIQSGTYAVDKTATGKLQIARAFALTAFGQERVDDMIAAVEMAVAADGSNPFYRVHEAWLKYMLKNDSDIVCKVAELYPRDPYAILLAAQVRSRDEPQAALKAIEHVLALPNLPRAAVTEAHYQAMRIHASERQHDKAVASINSCMVHCGNGLFASPLGSHDLRTLLSFRMSLAHEAGQFEMAEADALELILRDPNNPVYAHSLTLTQLDLGRPVTAAAAAEGTVPRFPNYSQRSVLLAAVYNRVGRHKDAIAALDGFDHDAASLTELALALHFHGNRQSALEKLDVAVKGKDFAPAVALRAVLRAADPKATADEKKQAAVDAEAALKIDPNGWFGHVAKMLAAAAAGDNPGATAAADKAIPLCRRPQPIKDELARAREAYKAGRAYSPPAELILAVPSYRLPALTTK